MIVCLAGASLCAAGWLYTARRLRRALERAKSSASFLAVDQEVLDLAEDAAGFGVWEHDPIKNVITLSAGAARLSGYPAVAGPRSGDELLERIHPDDRDKAIREAREGQSFQSEFRVRIEDGSYRWRRNRGRVESRNGQRERIVGAIIDIHDEKVLLEQLAQNADRLTLAEDVAGFGVWEADVANHTMTLSAGAAALSGFERVSMHVTSRQVMERTHPDDVARVAAVVARAIERAEPYRVDCRVNMPDGSLRWIRSQARVEVANGTPFRVTGAIIDITREKVLLEQLEEARARAEAAAQPRASSSRT